MASSDDRGFWNKLPSIVLAIVEADFIAIALENSGTEVQDSLPNDGLSLEQVYGRCKAAASTYETLQFGITTIRWDNDVYHLQQFSIQMSPFILKDTTEGCRISRLLDRTLTFSQASLHSLMSQGWDMQNALSSGVPYLSRTEANVVVFDLLDKDSSDSYNWSALNDKDKMHFLDLRRSLTSWVQSTPRTHEFWAIDPEPGVLRMSTFKVITRMIREEFPQCGCYMSADRTAIVIRVMPDIQTDLHRASERARRSAIWKQLGLATVFEALVADRWLDVYEQRGIRPTDKSNEWKQLLGKLRQKPRAIVGWNIMNDLCFLCRAFVGTLPDSLSEFQSNISVLFPCVFDLRVMTSDETGPDTAVPNLENMCRRLEAQLYPCCEAMKCNISGSFSETVPVGVGQPGLPGMPADAGFNSFMIATVFLKLACKKLRLTKMHPTRWPSEGRLEGMLFLCRQDAEGMERTHKPSDKNLSEEVHLPGPHNALFDVVRNKLRLSTTGTLNL